MVSLGKGKKGTLVYQRTTGNSHIYTNTSRLFSMRYTGTTLAWNNFHSAFAQDAQLTGLGNHS